MEHNIRDTLNKKEICIVVFIDLAGAFDRVWHMAILYKLKLMGFKGRILGWLYSYLQDRKFKAIVEGVTSTNRNISSSVPQGAVLSPTLFNILLSDLVKVDGVMYSEFADDIAIYSRGNDVQQVKDRVQGALTTINNWATYWGQSLNIQKTKAMYFTNKRNYPNNINLDGNDVEYVQKFKFLGVYFDGPRLTWKEHINHLRVSCSKSISVMKSIANNHWGADRQTLLKFYKSVIRSKLDYACHLYNDAASATLDTLNVIQNQCLRIALGVRMTTPILSLHMEANVPPLELRRKFLSIKYYYRITDYPQNNPINHYLNYNCNANCTNKTFISRTRQSMKKWNLCVPGIHEVELVSPIPPWSSIDEYLREDFFGESPRDMSESCVKQIFSDSLVQNFSDYVHIYTDGSKDEVNVSTGLVVPQNNISKGFKLHPGCTILFAELYGIQKAFDWIKMNEIRKSVIFTDSMSSIMLIKSRKLGSYKTAVLSIQSNLIEANNHGSAVVQWVPGHKGIAGNEKADRVAKAAKFNDVSERVRLPYEENVQVLKKRSSLGWQVYWDNMTQATNRGNFLKQIKNRVKYWSWTTNKSRILETSLARLRVGHVGLSQHLFRFEMSDSPLCSCGELENVKHFLLECNLYTLFRNEMIYDIRERLPNAQIDIKLLLGGSDNSEKIQKDILKYVGKYLRQTGRLTEL